MRQQTKARAKMISTQAHFGQALHRRNFFHRSDPHGVTKVVQLGSQHARADTNTLHFTERIQSSVERSLTPGLGTMLDLQLRAMAGRKSSSTSIPRQRIDMAHLYLT